MSATYDFMEGPSPTEIGYVDSERVDARLALVGGRGHGDGECALPVVLAFHRSVEIARNLDPLDFQGSVARRQYRPHFHAARFRLSAFLWRCVAVELADERLGLRSGTDIRVDAVDCLPLRDAVRGDHAKVADPVEEGRALETVIHGRGLFGRYRSDGAPE
jgi:hypothetical protein